jgi:hypothetical protein
LPASATAIADPGSPSTGSVALELRDGMHPSQFGFNVTSATHRLGRDA